MPGPTSTASVGAELDRLGEAELVRVDRDHLRRAPQARRQDRGEADRACADDRDRVAGPHAAREHPDLVAGGQRVGEEDRLLVADALGDGVERGVGVGHPHELGLRAVDEVAEDPADAADGLAVRRHAALAVHAPPALGDRRDQHPVATANPLTASPTAVIVPTASWPRMRPSVTAATSPCRMCRSVPQIVVVSTLTTTSVGSWTVASGTSAHSLLPGPWYTNAFIGTSVARDAGLPPRSSTVVAPITAGVSENRTIRSGRQGARRADRPGSGTPDGRRAPPSGRRRRSPTRRPSVDRVRWPERAWPSGCWRARGQYGWRSRWHGARPGHPHRLSRPGTAPPWPEQPSCTNTVSGLTVTVNAFPLVVEMTVQLVAVSAVIWPRTPCSTFLLARRAGSSDADGARGWPSCCGPRRPPRPPRSAPISSGARMSSSWRRASSNQVRTTFTVRQNVGLAGTIVIVPTRTRCSTGARS